MSTTGTFCGYQPSSISVTIVARPPLAASASHAPGRRTVHHHDRHARLARQIIEIGVPRQCRCPSAHRRRIDRDRAERALLSNSSTSAGSEAFRTTILPLMRSAEDSAGSWFLANSVPIERE
jgi:hypothetical protein